MIVLSKAGKCGTAIAIGLCVASFTVYAEPHDDHHWHGDIRNFHVHDYPHWREGRWYHGDHGGRLGWWWIAAGMWYFYPAPVYPYPDPYTPPVVVEPAPAPPATSVPPPAQSWYYCNSSRAYYPYASECPEGWKKVPAQPSNAPPQ